METKIIILIILIAIIILGILAYIGNFFYNYALNPKASSSKDKTKNQALDIDSNSVANEDNILGELNWFEKESNFLDISIKSFDDLKLHGYKIINQNLTNNWVITVHGYSGQGIEMTSYAKKYYEAGFNILIPDLRGHGLSDGNYIGMGWHDRLDILKWIELLIKDNENSNIILHGVSMGSSTVTMTSGENLPLNVKAIIADCGYSSVWDEFSHQLKSIFKLPSFPVLNAASIVTKFRAGYNLKEASSLNQVKKSKTPILFIHGDKDGFVPYEMMEKIYNATASEKEMLTIKEANHARSYQKDPDTYWNSVFRFINKHIN